jgi:hypothetical protein
VEAGWKAPQEGEEDSLPLLRFRKEQAGLLLLDPLPY